MLTSSFFLFFFFFQAEDGIRDYKVTGVQTCALPIGDISLILLLFESATNRLPLPSMATAEGCQNKARLAFPSALPAKPAVPANVVTTPAAVIFRIVLFPVSAT